MKRAPKSGTKKDDGKPRFDLLSTIALTGAAEVLRFGAEKYDADNWRKGMAWRRLIRAATSHLLAFSDGEDVDSESGLPHIDHLLCCAIFLSEYQKKEIGTDDRFKKSVESDTRVLRAKWTRLETESHELMRRINKLNGRSTT